MVKRDADEDETAFPRGGGGGGRDGIGGDEKRENNASGKRRKKTGGMFDEQDEVRTVVTDTHKALSWSYTAET